MKTLSRNIGGSLLPSSDPQILKPIQASFGTLQVVPLPDEDTHALVLNGETTLAKHPNGYSCHALAERMQSGNVPLALDQADFIVRCGGFSMDADSITKIMQPLA